MYERNKSPSIDAAVAGHLAGRQVSFALQLLVVGSNHGLLYASAYIGLHGPTDEIDSIRYIRRRNNAS